MSDRPHIEESALLIERLGLKDLCVCVCFKLLIKVVRVVSDG